MNRKQWRVFRAQKKLPPLTETGKALMSMEIGQHVIRPWGDERRPKGPAEVNFGKCIFLLEPLEEGLKITRVE